MSGGYTPPRLRFGWMPPHPTFYVRRAFLDGMQFDLRYRIAADYDFMLRCLRKANAVQRHYFLTPKRQNF